MQSTRWPNKGEELPHATLVEWVYYDPIKGMFTWQYGVRKQYIGKPLYFYIDKTGYVRIVIRQREYRAHRLAWFYMTGKWPTDTIDHINFDTQDNRFINLQELSRRDNLKKKAPDHYYAPGPRGADHPSSRPIITPKGRFSSMTEAALAFDTSRQLVKYWVGKREGWAYV